MRIRGMIPSAIGKAMEKARDVCKASCAAATKSVGGWRRGG